MKRLIWSILGLLVMSIMAILLAKSLQWSEECQRPIQIVRLLPTQEIQHIVDLRTGLQIETVIPNIIGLSPNGTYQYIAPDLPTIFNNIDLVNIATGQSQPIYSTTNELSIIWAANSQSLYLMEVEQVNRSRVPTRFVRIDAETGEITHEYLPPSNIFTMTSADQRFLYFSHSADDAETDEWRAINTSTGEMTDFRFSASANFSWSPDGEWVILRDVGELYVVDAETSAPHPHIPVINGHTPYWTDNSIWFRGASNDGQTIILRRASLSDGSVSVEYNDTRYGDIIFFTTSPDERWRYLVFRDSDSRIDFLHDTLTNTYYHDVNTFSIKFSADSRCLISVQGNPTDTYIVIYDLKTMQAIFSITDDRSLGNSSLYNLQWYQGDS